MKLQQSKRNSGFTLVELLIVVVILGLISATVVATVSTNTDSATKLVLERTHRNMTNNWSQLVAAAGVPKTVAANAVLATNATAIDVLVYGVDFVVAAQQPNYDQSNILPLIESFTVDTVPVSGTSAGAYSVEGFGTTIATPSTREFTSIYASVPSSIVELMWADQYSAAFVPGTPQTAGPIQYSAASGGTHTLTLSTTF